MVRLFSIVLFSLTLTASSPALAQGIGSWKYGTALQFTTEDGDFKVKVGGRIHQSFTWWTADSDYATASANPEDGTIFRRARLYMAGTIYGNIGFKAQYDFAGGDADFKDMFIELKDVPYVSNVRIGQFHEPFGLETLTSSNYMTFIERSSGTGPISPERSTGIMIHDRCDEERMSWALGAFRLSDDGDGDLVTENSFTFTGRATYLPWESEDRKDIVHVGVAASVRDPEEGMVRYTADPSVRPAVDFLDTGMQMVDMVTQYGLEVATVLGPWSAQAEYMMAMNDGSSGAEDFDISDFYISGSYFFTGESREYSRKTGSFTRIKPNSIYGKDGGLGAFEGALRYSMTDFDDGMINGGSMNQITLGLNWYLNPNVRVMSNIVLVDTSDIAGNVGVDGNAEAFTMRFQIDF